MEVVLRRAVAVLVGGALLGVASVGAQRPVPLPHAPCATRGVVPALAPDSVPEAMLDSLGTATTPARPGMRYLRNLIAARFDSTASQADRQAAVDGVCGVVVGGDYSGGGPDGFYFVRLQGAESVSALDAAVDALRHMPGVRSAQTLALRLAGAARSSSGGSGACAGVADGGELRVAAVKEMVASRDADEITMMTRLGLAGVDSTAVSVVTDAGVCGRVAAAIASAVHFTPQGTPFLILRAGPRYVAFDPTGRNRAFFLVDTAFVFRSVLR